MRIPEHANTDMNTINKPITNKDLIVESEVIEVTTPIAKFHELDHEQSIEEIQGIKTKVKDAVNKMNEMLEVNHSSSKFIYHEGLERYYVTVVNKDTDEVVKEIPPKKLLDAFYEMQKMLGMIVDERI